MPRTSYGPLAKKQTKRLLAVILAYANKELESIEYLQIKANWQTENWLIVHTNVRCLEVLTTLVPGSRLTKVQIKEALKRLEHFLGILEDHRLNKRGSEQWHFTLKLWHERKNKELNLQQFDREWQRRQPEKIKSEENYNSPSNLYQKVQELESLLEEANLKIQELEGKLEQVNRADNSKIATFKLRSGAAKTQAQLQGLIELYLLYYEDIQPCFVKTSEVLAEHFDIIKTRDYLWKQLQSIRRNTRHQISKQQLNLAYLELCDDYPNFYNELVGLEKEIKEIEEFVFTKFLIATQHDVLWFSTFPKNKYKTAMLGNALRNTASIYRDFFKSQTDKLLKPIYDFLINLITAK
ncbi:hypothetical protein ACE1CI_00975 [Aerosakkonemataceae cyanobacterium BLCC-F50]|uniref:Effector-associated domain-containing protein n=1 Tax=Floridaenema flaviceps BLCC-F50 TaxID=3153642 RepID=A0ABV4XIF7_9CYAN